IEPCTIGEGDVDQLGCLKVLKDSGYDGYVALEYEGPENEKTGVPKSLEFIKNILSKL
ncbi:sugar phosphate isomerase/epimerase, partial [bacterium]|nr:sugar phosphate isomerase/epimerase [bacterium]